MPPFQDPAYREVPATTPAFDRIRAVRDNHGVDLLIAAGWSYNVSDGIAPRCLRLDAASLPHMNIAIAAIDAALTGAA